MLFKDTSEIQQYLPVSSTFTFDEIKPFVKQAERDFIIPVVDKELYEELNAAFEGSTLSGTQEDLLEKIQTALASFSFMLWIPFGQTQIDSSGIRIVTTDGLKTAFQWQIEDLKGSASKSGYSAIEDLFEFLEENKSDYPTWTASDAYTKFKKHFIKSAKEFQQYYNINSSRRTFVAMLPIMNRIEDTLIRRTIGADLYTEIKDQLKTDTLTADNEAIVNLIRPAVANLTISRAISELAVRIDENGIGIANNLKEFRELKEAKSEILSNLQYESHTDGQSFLKELEELINEDADDYDDGPYENDSDHGIGLF